MEPVALPEDDAVLLAFAGITDPPDPAEGLFRADSWIRKIHAEGVLVFGGGRALLLEVAHPLVAAGVARFSDFGSDPFGRLRRTLEALRTLTFAPCEAALEVARHVEQVHRHVRGTLSQGTRRFPSGTPYSGRDPESALWVWATLVDTSLVMYERFVAELDGAAREAYYADQCILGRLLGVPAALVPPSYSEFRGYFEGVLGDGTLEVTAEGREIGRAVLASSSEIDADDRLEAITAALLPESLRAPFGLIWDDAREERFESLVRSVRALRPEEGGLA